MILNKQITVPVKDTYYFCQLFPLQNFDRAVHLTQFEILINPKNKRNFHHVLVYECISDYVPEEIIAQECGYVYLPSEVAKNCIKQQIIGWAIGGEPIYKFPLEAGYRLSPSIKTQYLLILLLLQFLVLMAYLAY